MTVNVAPLCAIVAMPVHDALPSVSVNVPFPLVCVAVTDCASDEPTPVKFRLEADS